MTRSEKAWEILVDGDLASRLEAIQKDFPSVRLIDGGLEADCDDSTAINALIDCLRKLNISIVGVAKKRSSLEEVFIRTVSS